jgi:hypothetical protein
MAGAVSVHFANFFAGGSDSMALGTGHLMINDKSGLICRAPG